MQAGLSTQNAPSPKVVLPHFVFGAVSFLVAAVVMILYAGDLLLPFHLNSKMLVLTHVTVLGFLTTLIIGALYQLIPVVMEVKLFSEKIGYITFYLFTAGVVILVITFWEASFDANQNWLWFEISGTMILTAVLLFAVNTLKSAAKSTVKTRGNVFIKTAIIYLLLTVSLAITMIINFAVPFLPVSVIDLLKMHMHLGLVGWFMFLVIGVSSKLMPMFLIIHKLPEKLLDYSYYFLNAGLILLVLVFSFYSVQWALVLSGVLLFAGIVFYLKYIHYAFKHRFRKNLDTGMKMSAVAYFILVLVLVFGVVSLLFPGFWGVLSIHIDVVYGMSFVLGFLMSLVLGQTYKTLPFIIWLEKYQSKVGKQKVPLPQELYSEKLAEVHMKTFLAAFVLLIAGELTALKWLIQAAGVLFLITALLYNYNVFKIVLHKEKTLEK
jgi:hypothetical protein